MTSFPKLVIFDLDGTLVEFPHDYIFSQAKRILAEFEHPEVPRHELADHFSAFDFFRFVAQEAREEFIVRFWKAFDWDNYPKAKSFASTGGTLDFLSSRGAVSSIATARLNSEAEIRKDLELSGWLHHISCIKPRAGEHIHWTDKTEQIQQICHTLGVSPRDAILVGDIPTDVTSAREVGIGKTIAVLSGGLKREILEKVKPDYLLESIEELPGLFSKTYSNRERT